MQRIKVSLQQTILSVLAILLVGPACLADSSEPIRIDSAVLRPMHEAEVPAQQTGVLLEVVVREGARVERGELLASLDASVARHLLEQAQLEQLRAEAKAKNRSQIEYAQKALEVARAELRRSDESLKKFAKSVSQSQVDVEQLTVDKLALGLRQAQFELELAQMEQKLKKNELAAASLRLEQHQIVAPFAGTVVLVRGRVGEWVEAGTPVLRLVATDTLRAEGFVDADSLTSKLIGKPVQLTSRGTNQPVTASGVLQFVSPEMEPVTGQVRIWAKIDNRSQRLRPGQQGMLEIAP